MFTREKYDEPVYNQYNNASLRVFGYKTDINQMKNKSQCFMNYPGNGYSNITHPASHNTHWCNDEIELKGQTSNRELFAGYGRDKVKIIDKEKFTQKNVDYTPTCSINKSSEASRYTNPIQNYREMTNTRLDPNLYDNYTRHPIIFTLRGKDTVNEAKDSYVRKPQKMIDQSKFLPSSSSNNMYYKK